MNRTVAYFSMAMSIFFMAMGVIFPIYRPPVLAGTETPDYVFYLIGLVLLAYGIFRFWRAYKILKDPK